MECRLIMGYEFFYDSCRGENTTYCLCCFLCYFGVCSITGGIIFDTVALPIEPLIILHTELTIASPLRK